MIHFIIPATVRLKFSKLYYIDNYQKWHETPISLYAILFYKIVFVYNLKKARRCPLFLWGYIEETEFTISNFLSLRAHDIA